MISHIIEKQSNPKRDTLKNVVEVCEENTCRCPHLERWLPHVLDLDTLPSETLDSYIIENPIHAMHLESNLGLNRDIHYGEEQTRAGNFWHSPGVMNSYIPGKSSLENKHYYRKRLKIDEMQYLNSQSDNIKNAEQKDFSVNITSEQAPSFAQVDNSSDMIIPKISPIISGNNKVKTCNFLMESIAPVPSSTDDLVKLSESRFQELNWRENHIIMHRCNLFAKREKRKTNKKNKKRDSLPNAEFLKKNIIISQKDQESVSDSEAWKKEMQRAKGKVENWMRYFRRCRLNYWHSIKDTNCCKVREFGKKLESETELTCQICTTQRNLSGDDVMMCLDCGYLGDAPHSLSPKSNQQIILHMLTKNHQFAVTCGKRNSLYCFGCGDVIYHKIFDAERERIDFHYNLPEWAWAEHSVQRSFDAFQFASSPEHGITWRGILATYPAIVPQNHIEAAKLICQRKFLHNNPQISAPVGLHNLGNMCFMNGIIQCLIHCPPFQTHFLTEIRHDHRVCFLFRHSSEDENSNIVNRYSCLACKLDVLFLDYFGSTIGQNVPRQLNVKAKTKGEEEGEKGFPLTPSDLLIEAWKQREMEHLKGYEQRDAHEFLQAFLDVVGKHAKEYEMTILKNLKYSRSFDNKTNYRKSLDIVKHLFEGSLRSVSICESCGCKRTLQEPFINVSLPLSQDSPSQRTNQKLSIRNCLDHFTAPESLVDPIECPQCKQKTPTKKQQTFSRLPKILCLHLKRFDSAKNKKITDFVSFPARGLDMGPLLPHWSEATMSSNEITSDKDVSYPRVLYDLYGTVNHTGTLNQGHYISHVFVNQNWYYCNDAHISMSKESEVLNSEGAYMLFYIRR